MSSTLFTFCSATGYLHCKSSPRLFPCFISDLSSTDRGIMGFLIEFPSHSLRCLGVGCRLFRAVRGEVRPMDLRPQRSRKFCCRFASCLGSMFIICCLVCLRLGVVLVYEGNPSWVDMVGGCHISLSRTLPYTACHSIRLGTEHIGFFVVFP